MPLVVLRTGETIEATLAKTLKNLSKGNRSNVKMIEWIGDSDFNTLPSLI
jgi:hypothetical protein